MKITLEVPDHVIDIADRPHRTALRIAIWAYLEEFGPEGYREGDFIAYARTWIEDPLRKKEPTNEPDSDAPYDALFGGRK